MKLKRLLKYSFVILIIIISILVGYGIRNSMPQRAFHSNLTFEYPSDFYISYQDNTLLLIENREWQGKHEYNPTVGIRWLNGVIPPEMKLTEWLSGIGRVEAQGSFKNISDLCKNFIDRIRNEINEFPYGDGAVGLGKKEGDCWYFDVSDIKKVNVPPGIEARLKGSNNYEAIEFISRSLNNSEVTKSVLITFGTGSIIEIFKSETRLSKPTDGTTKAYESIMNTISFLSAF